MSMWSKNAVEFEIRGGIRDIVKAEIALATNAAKKKGKRTWMEFNEAPESRILSKEAAFDENAKNLQARIERLQTELGLDIAEYKEKQA